MIRMNVREEKDKIGSVSIENVPVRLELIYAMVT